MLMDVAICPRCRSKDCKCKEEGMVELIKEFGEDVVTEAVETLSAGGTVFPKESLKGMCSLVRTFNKMGEL